MVVFGISKHLDLGGGIEDCGGWGLIENEGPANDGSFILCPSKNFLLYIL